MTIGYRLLAMGEWLLAIGYGRWDIGDGLWALGDGIWRRGERRVTAFFVGKYRKYHRYLCMSFFFITFVAEWRRECELTN